VPESTDKRLAAGIAVVLLGISIAGIAAAHADMVMDALEGQ
jgi:hypothetical protein